jgi:hypothetical protein
MKERLLADLDARIARHADGDSTGVLDDRALALVEELAALGGPDAGSLVRVAALHLCRYQALPSGHGEADLGLARALYTNLHSVDPRLVTPRVREFFGFTSPYESGLALMREYGRTGGLDHLERAISLFRQEVLEHRARGLHSLGMALLRRFEHTGRPADLDEAVSLGRAALAGTPVGHPWRPGLVSWLATALRRRFDRDGDQRDLAEATGLGPRD